MSEIKISPKDEAKTQGVSQNKKTKRLRLWGISVLTVLSVVFYPSVSKQPLQFAATSPPKSAPLKRKVSSKLSFEFQKIDQSFGQLKWVSLKNQNKIVLLFPDNTYLGGKFELSDESKKELDRVIEKFKPFGETIQMTFIGHADQKPVQYSKTKSLQSNGDLSLVRAQVALYYALNRGVSEKTAFAKSDSSLMRSTRSLSIVIEPSNN